MIHQYLEEKKTCSPFHNLAFLRISIFKEKEHKPTSRLLTGSKESYNKHNLKHTSFSKSSLCIKQARL